MTEGGRPAAQPLLLDGLASTRTIRRYTDEPIPESDLATILFHATRAPSGSVQHGPVV